MATKATAQQDLQKAEKAIVKLRNKVNRADLEYTVQISISSVDPTVVRYAAQMTAPANNLAPVTFIANSAEDLVEKIKTASKGINYEEIEKAYHRSQIDACHRTIKHHEDRLERIDNPEPETEAQPEPTEEQPVSTEQPKEGEGEANGK